MRFRRHTPSYMDPSNLSPASDQEVETVADLLALPWVASFRDLYIDGRYCHSEALSTDETLLMIEGADRETGLMGHWVLGYVSPASALDELPEWVTR